MRDLSKYSLISAENGINTWFKTRFNKEYAKIIKMTALIVFIFVFIHLFWLIYYLKRTSMKIVGMRISCYKTDTKTGFYSVRLITLPPSHYKRKDVNQDIWSVTVSIYEGF